MNATRRYAQSQNETASPERLMVLLFEAALRHMRGGAASLEKGRRVDADAALTRASDIVAHLDATFDNVRFPELGKNLGVVYRFVCQRLLSGKLKNDPAPVREAGGAFFPVADAFSIAVQQLAAERAAHRQP